MNNREILFRGFNEDDNGAETIYIDGKEVKGNWVYGYYGKKETNSEVEHFIIKETLARETLPSFFTDYYVIPETVGQYTGLKDTNGNKIFEGDILRYREHMDNNSYKDWFDKVYFNEDYGTFEVKSNEYDSELLGFRLSEIDAFVKYEVIGSIFDKGRDKN